MLPALPSPAPPLAPPPIPFVVVREEQAPATARGKPGPWHRWIEIRIPARGCVFGFKADARSLTFDGAMGARARAEILAPGFEPLCAERTVRMLGADHVTTEPPPGDVAAIAIEACRAAALRLYAFGVDRADVTRPWPKRLAAFAGIVKGEPRWEEGPAPAPVPYPKRRQPRRRKSDARPFP